MAVKLATPSFVTGPTDKLATTDIYQKINNVVINDIQSLATSYNLDLTSVLRGGDFLKNNLPIFNDLVNGKFSIDPANLTARLLGSSDVITNALRGLSDSPVGDAIVSSVKDIGDVFSVVGDVASRIASSAIEDIRGLGKLVGEYVGNPTLFQIDDIDSKVGLLSGIISEATKLGIPNSVAALLSTTPKDILHKVAGNILPAIIAHSDTASLKDLSDLTGYSTINLLNPSVLSDFSKSYNSSLQCTAADYKEDYGNVMDAFSSVNSGWDTISRPTTAGADVAINITPLQDTSIDFKKLLDIGIQTTLVSKEKYYALAKLFPKTNVEQEVKKQYPYTILQPSAQVDTVTYDPRSFF